MKATVITTGPGVIIATATASRNCLSVSQPVLLHDAAVEEGHDGQAAAEHEGAGLGEEPDDLQHSGRCRGGQSGRQAQRPASAGRHVLDPAQASSRRGGAFTSQHDDAAPDEQPAHLGLGPPRCRRAIAAGSPTAAGRAPIVSRTSFHALAHDDADHRRADAVERRLHPRRGRRRRRRPRPAPSPSGTTAARTPARPASRRGPRPGPSRGRWRAARRAGRARAARAPGP